MGMAQECLWDGVWDPMGLAQGCCGDAMGVAQGSCGCTFPPSTASEAPKAMCQPVPSGQGSHSPTSPAPAAPRHRTYNGFS